MVPGRDRTRDQLCLNVTSTVSLPLTLNVPSPVAQSVRPNKKYLCSYLNLLVKARIFSGFLLKNIISKCIKLYFFPEKKNKKKCVPTLPKIFRPVTRNRLIFLFGQMDLIADPGVMSLIPALSHTFVEIDHEILSMFILLLPVIQGLVQRSQACPGKSVVGLTDRLNMTIAVDWDIKPQTKQNKDTEWFWQSRQFITNCTYSMSGIALFQTELFVTESLGKTYHMIYRISIILYRYKYGIERFDWYAALVTVFTPQLQVSMWKCSLKIYPPPPPLSSPRKMMIIINKTEYV